MVGSPEGSVASVGLTEARTQDAVRLVMLVSLKVVDTFKPEVKKRRKTEAPMRVETVNAKLVDSTCGHRGKGSEVGREPGK